MTQNIPCVNQSAIAYSGIAAVHRIVAVIAQHENISLRHINREFHIIFAGGGGSGIWLVKLLAVNRYHTALKIDINRLTACCNNALYNRYLTGFNAFDRIVGIARYYDYIAPFGRIGQDWLL